LSVIQEAFLKTHKGDKDDAVTMSRTIEELLYVKYLGDADPDDAVADPVLNSKLGHYRAHVRSVSLDPRQIAVCPPIPHGFRRVSGILRNPDASDFRMKLISGEMEAQVFVDLKADVSLFKASLIARIF
jgi:hypothetical protein